MRRMLVYALAFAAEAVWIALWLFLLGSFRRDPVAFFETLLFGIIFAGFIAWQAKRRLDQPPVFLGRLSSRIDDWRRLQAVMRDDELQRRRRGS